MTTVLRPLGEETWGQRLRRAREESCLTVRATAEILTQAGFDVSHATIARLEHSTDRPAGIGQRLTACAALIIYGINPDELDLADVHQLINVETVAALSPKVAAPTIAPRRRSSGRRPSAGSGSSPRRSGCSPHQFAEAA
jgi:hypothetical protein